MVDQKSGKPPLRVGDLFCGAGGFAEGFRQAGFEIVWGVDVWKPAVTTFQKNYPRAESIQADVRNLDPGTLPSIDVLIGSPPCVHFSLANRGGNGDREKGMELVTRFLELVHAINPRYWVMENVVGVRGDLEAKMDGDAFRLPNGKSLQIPDRLVLDASRFGAPQARRRLFSGHFPHPVEERGVRGDAILTLRDVIDGLPSPDAGSQDSPALIRDPLYSGLSVARSELRDHFEDDRWKLSAADAQSSRYWKVNNPVYGVMSFPDELDRPARTITATRTRGSRATIVIPYRTVAGHGFRTLTVRECASVQGFPITYQFWGGSRSEKDFLVGNAVCPPVARAVAHAILRADGRPAPQSPVVQPASELPPIVVTKRNRIRYFSMRRRYRGIVPVDWRHDHRVELDNELPTVRAELPADVMPPITWRTRIYLGYATLYKRYEVGLGQALLIARQVVRAPDSGIDCDGMSRALLPVAALTLNGFPDGISLQSEWARWRKQEYGPDWVTARVAEAVDRSFPASVWGTKLIPAVVTSGVFEQCRHVAGKGAQPGQPIPVSARLLVATVMLSMACCRLNYGEESLQVLHDALMTSRGLNSRRLDPLVWTPGSTREVHRTQSSLALRMVQR